MDHSKILIHEKIELIWQKLLLKVSLYWASVIFPSIYKSWYKRRSSSCLQEWNKRVALCWQLVWDRFIQNSNALFNLMARTQTTRFLVPLIWSLESIDLEVSWRQERTQLGAVEHKVHHWRSSTTNQISAGSHQRKGCQSPRGPHIILSSSTGHGA